ncbi:MAG: hypothetical protein DRQ48_05880 [Gammaproteobacteria bacterium]|nr:MAG: hypothetical protein DRQ48_05880 [Gammaproteobacteria bacterium]
MFEGLERITYQSGDQIFQEGDVSNCAYLIEGGGVEISIQREKQPFRVSILTVGDLFGEMALIDKQPRIATATALDETCLVRISRDALEDKLTKVDPIIEHLLRLILRRFRKTHYRLTQKDYLLPEDADQVTDVDFDRTQENMIVHVRIASDIIDALSRNEFELHYQPIYSIKDNRIVGFEALSRWHHPVYGIMSPMQFIDIAESSDQILSIGLWVLEKACADLKTLSEEYEQSQLFVSVNISARQLANAEHIAKFIGVVEQAGVDPACINLEVTETMLISELDYAQQTLSSLQEQGFMISLDDFGTGFSSLSHLQKFPVNMIKIDRSFVRQMLLDHDSMQIVKASIGLAQALDLETVAEGVENEDELARLAELKCDYAQGYCFTKPLPLAKLIEYLKQQ